MCARVRACRAEKCILRSCSKVRHVFVNTVCILLNIVSSLLGYVDYFGQESSEVSGTPETRKLQHLGCSHPPLFNPFQLTVF